MYYVHLQYVHLQHDGQSPDGAWKTDTNLKISRSFIGQSSLFGSLGTAVHKVASVLTYLYCSV